MGNQLYQRWPPKWARFWEPTKRHEHLCTISLSLCGTGCTIASYSLSIETWGLQSSFTFNQFQCKSSAISSYPKNYTVYSILIESFQSTTKNIGYNYSRKFNQTSISFNQIQCKSSLISHQVPKMIQYWSFFNRNQQQNIGYSFRWVWSSVTWHERLHGFWLAPIARILVNRDLPHHTAGKLRW